MNTKQLLSMIATKVRPDQGWLIRRATLNFLNVADRWELDGRTLNVHIKPEGYFKPFGCFGCDAGHLNVAELLTVIDTLLSPFGAERLVIHKTNDYHRYVRVDHWCSMQSRELSSELGCPDVPELPGVLEWQNTVTDKRKSQ